MDRTESDRWAARRAQFKKGLPDRRETSRKASEALRKQSRYQAIQRRREKYATPTALAGDVAAATSADPGAASGEFDTYDHLNLRLSHHPMINMEVFNLSVAQLVANPGDVNAIEKCLVRLSIPEHAYTSELPETIPASQVNSLYLAHLQQLSDKLTPVTLPMLNNAIKIIVNPAASKEDLRCADNTLWLISNILSAESLDAVLCGPELVARLLYIVKYMIDKMETRKPYWRTTLLVAVWSLSNVFGDPNCVLQFQNFDKIAGVDMAIPNGFELMMQVMQKFKPGMEEIADQVGFTITNIVRYGNLDQSQADKISDVIVALCTEALKAKMTIMVTNTIHSFYYLNITHAGHRALGNAIGMFMKGAENPLENACWIRYLAQTLVRHITSGYLIDSVATLVAGVDWSKLFCTFLDPYTKLRVCTLDVKASISSILELMSHLVRMEKVHAKLYTSPLVGLIKPYIDNRGTSSQRVHAMGFYSSPGSMDLDIEAPSMQVLIAADPVNTIVNFMVSNKHSSHVWLFQCCGKILMDMAGVEGMEQAFMEHVDEFHEIEEVLERMGETSLAAELVEFVMQTEKEAVDAVNAPDAAPDGSFQMVAPFGNPFASFGSSAAPVAAPHVMAAVPPAPPVIAALVPDDVDTDM